MTLLQTVTLADRHSVSLNVPRYRKFLLLGALLALAGLSVWSLALRADREMRAQLQQQTRLLALSLHSSYLHSLSGTAEDLNSPEYKYLKEVLASVRKSTEKCRFIYIMGRRPGSAGATNAAPENEEIFMYVVSEEAGSKDYSPPGERYEEASDELRSVFNKGVGLVEGPTPDRWGVWVTAFSPI
jgi:hypothetical protein